jgi:hypothetical protein
MLQGLNCVCDRRRKKAKVISGFEADAADGDVAPVRSLNAVEMDKSYENLLSEVLLGLLGHTGGAFVIPTLQETVPGLKPTPVLSDHVDWVAAPDRQATHMAA